MPAVLIAIGSYIIAGVIARLLLALGIGVFTYYGLYTIVTQLIDQLKGVLTLIPSQVFQVLSLAGIPEGLSIICSALLTRAAIAAIQVFFGSRS